MGAGEQGFHHRSSLKQKNKPFKSRYATKNSQRDKAKGRTQRSSIKGRVLRKHSRADRRNALRTEQRKKKEQVLMSTRIFSGRHRAPKIVAMIPLCPDIQTDEMVRSLYECVDEKYKPASSKILHALRFKQSMQFVQVKRNFLDILDAAKVADYLVLGISAEVEVDDFGEQCLRAIQNQGHPGVFTIVQGLEAVPSKRRNDVKKSLQSFMSHFFPEVDKVYTVDTQTEGQAILRIISAQVPKTINWRDSRPYMLVDQVDFAPSEGADGSMGRVALTGYLRGANLSANRLVHIPNFGDYQIETITHVPVAVEATKGEDQIQEDDESNLLDQPQAEHQDSLVAANEPDTINNEQTWPEDEEMTDWQARMDEMEKEEEQIAKGQRVLRVPKGTSTYQAAWIAAMEDEEDCSGDDDDDDDGSMMGDNGDYSNSEDGEYDEILLDDKGKPIEPQNGQDDLEKGDEDADLLTPEEEAAQLAEYLRKREQQNRDDVEFPDEVDTPMDEPARERFARYRGLQSFRTSPWDPYENLPIDYARIFQFENYKRTQQRILRMTEDAPAKVGLRVCIVLSNAPARMAAGFDHSRPFVAFGLQQYEHQMSVVNFSLIRNDEYMEPVRSKDPLVLHMGFRRYNIRPLFSQNTPGGKGTNNVHKFERFLKHGVSTIGTIYAPIQFGKAPVSLYLPTSSASSESGEEPVPTVVATGSSMEADPTRIMAKRILLTGAPFKIHKRSAVIRYMFFSPEDVNWFKPVQLYTKYGRTGHITESLGTHGYMKCVFDGPIKQMDTVCMKLYKRVFPKWNTTLWSEHELTDESRSQFVGPVTAPGSKDVDMEI